MTPHRIDPGSETFAYIQAARKIQALRWLNRPPSHVFAEFAKQLNEMGYWLCAGEQEVGVGAGDSVGLGDPSAPSVDSSLDQFKRLRDELLGDGAVDAAVKAGGGHGDFGANRARAALAAAWDHATGHAPLSLLADSSLDQGGDAHAVAERETGEIRPHVAGATVDGGGGPETSDYCGCGHPSEDHGPFETGPCQSCDCEGYEYDELVTKHEGDEAHRAPQPEPQEGQQGAKTPSEIHWCHIHRVAVERSGCEQCLEETGGYSTHIYRPAESGSQIAELRARAKAAEQRAEALAEALTTIGELGCLVGHIRGKDCRDAAPHSEWCVACIATAALNTFKESTGDEQ